MSKEGLPFHDWKEAFSPEFGKPREKIPPLTKRQREWVKRAWDTVYHAPDGKHICGFPVLKHEKFYLHGPVPKVEIHHLVARGWASQVLGWSERQINSPLNLVPLCPYHHNGRGIPLEDLQDDGRVIFTIHPDMEVARRTYTGKEHPTTYDYAFEQREEMMRRFEKYWNDDWTQALLRKAEETYHAYLNWQLEKFGKYVDVWPERRT